MAQAVGRGFHKQQGRGASAAGFGGGSIVQCIPNKKKRASGLGWRRSCLGEKEKQLNRVDMTKSYRIEPRYIQYISESCKPHQAHLIVRTRADCWSYLWGGEN